MVVAVPKFNELIAPRFEVARHFMISHVEAGKETSSKIVECTGCEGFGRVQLIREHKANILLCDGIKGFYRDLLEAAGITVIANVSLPVGEALTRLLDGRLATEALPAGISTAPSGIPHDDLVCWARELFESNGYTVSAGTDAAPFPIDMVAVIRCPVCHKPVRVAVCCGAHTYRVDQEIREFHRVAASDFHARVYVHPGSASIRRCCQEYGIELIDPDAELAASSQVAANRIPVLCGPVAGHERMSRAEGT